MAEVCIDKFENRYPAMIFKPKTVPRRLGAPELFLPYFIVDLDPMALRIHNIDLLNPIGTCLSGTHLACRIVIWYLNSIQMRDKIIHGRDTHTKMIIAVVLLNIIRMSNEMK